jgi:hypothetical protein
MKRFGLLTLPALLFGATIACDPFDQVWYNSTAPVNLWNNVGTWQVAAVPEPATWAMMILGFAGVGYMTYRPRKVAALAA